MNGFGYAEQPFGPLLSPMGFLEQQSENRAVHFKYLPLSKSDIELAVENLITRQPVVIGHFHATTIDTINNEWDVPIQSVRKKSDFVVTCKNLDTGDTFRYPLNKYRLEDIVTDLLTM
jgi:hypothetical protein